MDRIKYKSLRDYLTVVERAAMGKVRLFRGQPCSKPLLPKIARRNPKKDTTLKEKQMLAELRRRGTLFIGRELSKDWDLLVYAQHFGMSTRLRDWTSNPLVALWFACTELDAGSPAYVYALSAANDLLLDSNKERDPFTVGKTRIFKPNLNNPRIVAQNGWFTAHRFAQNTGRFVPLEENNEIKNHLLEIEVPGWQKNDILARLDSLGVNSQSLFPDVEGVCKYINWVHTA